MRSVLRWWTIVLPFAVVAQITLVGVGAFHAANLADDNKLSKDGFESWFAPHMAFGYILVLSSLLYGLLSVATRDRRLMKRGGIVAGLFVLQVLLAWLGDGVPAVGWLHPLNALVILGYTGRQAYVEWEARSAVEAQAAPAAA
jgi:hypothetical protein